ncbi:uncharacterized protein NPIL_613051 [Nephila pilipes]|uniref:DUF4817 domain-containing protein n=1 Tax=Nephila pilipes TaxID=299642 RepID=A0A8X6R006_NEPPI|nr:uncharacterized protein NPIL_613051 [Nephila pilipes]
MDYTYEELTDLHLMYGQVNGNTYEARRLYYDLFPRRYLPSHPTYASVDRQLQRTSSFAVSNKFMGHLRIVWTSETKEYVLEFLEGRLSQDLEGGGQPILVSVTLRRFNRSINMWSGIVGDRIVDPYLLPYCLTGEQYFVFLEKVLSDLMQPVPSTTQTHVRFMHDRAPANFSIDVSDTFWMPHIPEDRLNGVDL